jgi:hypothetical protein
MECTADDLDALKIIVVHSASKQSDQIFSSSCFSNKRKERKNLLNRKQDRFHEVATLPTHR